MNKTGIRLSIKLFAYFVVLFPVWLRLKDLNWAPDAALWMLNIFPALGLVAFTLLWLHSISGVFEPWLRKHFDFDKFVHVTSLIILACIIFHPLLLLISLGFNFTLIFNSYGAQYIWLAIIGWFLLITYDIGKFFKKYDFFSRNWRNILVISTIGFILTFFHSISIGHDLQSGPMRIVWYFYGTTAIISTIYTYGIKRFITN